MPTDGERALDAEPRDHRDRERGRDHPREVVDDVVDAEHASPIPVGDRLLDHRVHGDLLPRERESHREAREQDAPVPDEERHGDRARSRPRPRTRRPTIVGFENRSSSLPDREDADQDAHPAGPDRGSRTRRRPRRTACRKTTRDSVRTMPCPIWSRVMDVIGPIARRVRRSVREPVGELQRDPPQLVPEQLGVLGLRVRLESTRDPRRDPRGDEPADARRDHHRRRGARRRR